MFASLGFLAERFQRNKPIRIACNSTFTTAEDICGYILTEEPGPIRVTLRGVLRLLRDAKPVLSRTIIDISQETDHVFNFPAFTLDGLPSTLSLISELGLELNYTLTASSALSECITPICVFPTPGVRPQAITKQLTCNMPGIRRVSPICSRNGLALRLDATSSGTITFHGDEATSKLTVVISCDEDHYPGTIHADVEWSLKAVTHVDDYVLRSTAVSAQRRQIRWSKWVSRAEAWTSEATIWVIVARGLPPSFSGVDVSHAHTLAVQLRLSTLAEQPKLSRIFNIEPEALVFELPMTVAYSAEEALDGEEKQSPGYDSV
jgi:hypothetical protein